MARTGNKNIQAKLVLLGDMGTGKTSLVLRFVKGQFFDFQESTIGAAFFTQVLSLNEATVKFDIWDTAGQERYHSLAPMYYRGAAAAVVVYDVTSRESFEKAKKWVQELQRQGNPNLIMFLVANKVDLKDKRKVGYEDGELYAKENGLSFLETSAKTAENVNELFYEIGNYTMSLSFLHRYAHRVFHRMQFHIFISDANWWTTSPVSLSYICFAAKRLVKASPLRQTGMKLHTGRQEGGSRGFCCS
ncbi:hypothetical protein Patl1_13224 [Pistacia atlantica]|uniref:Uncharacterized protein n=1 Tax=Pistacia atlantica TaxID=434234 RepID=A0ACC1AV73_9ROSI|nr:hypothetical protein Patl1_13224 [Pistacia atlantica]